MLWLWNYFRGYVVIEVTGFSVERFVNLAVHHGIYIWDVKFGKKGVVMKVSPKGFKMLRPFCRKTKCKVRILQKRGYPFIAFKYRKRKLLAGGFIFLVISLYLLSSFVWRIEIIGNDKLTNTQILTSLKSMGLDTGRVKYLIDTKKIKKTLQLKFNEISWVDVHIKGTRAIVNLSESIEKKEVEDKSYPCDIIAAKDGVITNMVTVSGTSVRKQKDIVRKGDILVKGEITAGIEGESVVREIVHAEAEVRARVFNEMSFFVPFKYTEKRYTGDTEKKYGLKILEKKFNLPMPGTKFKNYEKSISMNQLKINEDYPLPFFIYTEHIKEFREIELTRNIEQAKEYADKIITGRVVRELDIDADFVDKTFEYAQEPGGIRVNAVVVTIERIDQKQRIEANSL